MKKLILAVALLSVPVLSSADIMGMIAVNRAGLLEDQVKEIQVQVQELEKKIDSENINLLKLKIESLELKVKELEKKVEEK